MGNNNNYHLLERLARFPGGLFSVLSTLLILWLTLSPDPLGPDHPRLFPGADKVAHLLMFGFLTTMLLLDYTRKRDWLPARISAIAIAVIASAFLGCLIEVLQLVMNLGRGFEFTDMVADFAGAVICGAGWWLLINPWLHHIHENSN